MPKSATGTVCSRPGEACDAPYKRFAPYELPFRLPNQLADNTPVRSASFYAVVLQRRPGRESDCDGGEWTKSIERERRRLQKRFPTRKVFADHQCPDMGAVSYSVEGQSQAEVFIAVYAGATRDAALKMLSSLQGKFAGARIRRMNAVFERIVQ